jgi:tripartite-type tricarboxylate transporter receptor subunit TctC
MSGTVDVAFTPATPVMGLVQAGKLKVLGVIGRSRMTEWPEVPTLAQAGIVGFESALWFGLNAPVGTPPEVTQKIIQDIQWAMSLADIQAQLVSKGIQPLSMGQASFQEVIQREHAQWIRVIKQSGIRAE